MDERLKEEIKILNNKRELIRNELMERKDSIDKIGEKVKLLRKESKGNYNQEKENIEKVYEILHKEINGYEEALETPYFGRVDFREYRSLGESIYIGKRGINSAITGDEVVVDWRAPVADLYYSGTGGEAYYKAPGGIIEGKLELKRKFLFSNGNIKEVFDEGINKLMINGEEGQELVDEFLKINLEESRGKKLKEVVATIQNEQNNIIRWPKNLPIIVQGSAGSGKTTIALHRLAYLIYRYKDKIKAEEILILAPNKLFLNYISDILPSLGTNEVKQSTFEELVLSKLKIKGKIYNKDEKLKDIMEEKDGEKKKLLINSSRVKGTLIYKKMIDRFITLVESRALEINDILVEGYVLFSKKEIMRLYLKDLKAYPINKRKDEIKRYLNLKIKEKIEILLNKVDNEWDFKIKDLKNHMDNIEERRKKLIQIYDKRDDIKNKIKRNSKKEFSLYFKNWRGINSEKIYYNFFNDEELFHIATDDKIPEELATFMKIQFNKNCELKIIDEDDLAALLYIQVLLEGVDENEKFQHIVIDEAQDYSSFQIYLVNSLVKGNSLTLVGDLAQGIYYYKGINTWEDIIEELFGGKTTYIQLSQSYRSTVEIIDFAEGVLDAQKLGLKKSKSVLRHGEGPKIIKVDSEKNYADIIDNIIEYVKEKNKNSVAIITKDSREAEELYKLLKKRSRYSFELIKGKEREINENYIIIPSYLTKGLEFDCTIIFNPSNKNYKDSLLDKRLLYVSLTRALHFEYVIEKDRITSMIGDNNK